MDYPYIILILAAIELAYFFLAKKLKLGAPISERSAHTTYTSTGGGIVLLIAVVMFAIIHHHVINTEWSFMVGGTIVLGIMGYIDDIRPLPAKPRLLMQILVSALMFKQFIAFGLTDLFILYTIICVGCINAFNFIDGINGILTFLGAVAIASIVYGFYIYQPMDYETYVYYGIMLLIALGVFGVFNLVGKLFSGDVGSLIVGASVAYMLVNLSFAILDPTVLILVIVCLIDTGFTLVRRIAEGENVLKPHSKHAYQMLVNIGGMKHYAVAAIYGGAQLVINVIYFAIPRSWHYIYCGILIVILSAAYTVVRNWADKEQFKRQFLEK